MVYTCIIGYLTCHELQMQGNSIVDKIQDAAVAIAEG